MGHEYDAIADPRSKRGGSAINGVKKSRIKTKERGQCVILVLGFGIKTITIVEIV